MTTMTLTWQPLRYRMETSNDGRFTILHYATDVTLFDRQAAPGESLRFNTPIAAKVVAAHRAKASAQPERLSA